MAWIIVNQHHEEELLPSVTISAVYSVIKRLHPKIVIIGKKNKAAGILILTVLKLAFVGACNLEFAWENSISTK